MSAENANPIQVDDWDGDSNKVYQEFGTLKNVIQSFKTRLDNNKNPNIISLLDKTVSNLELQIKEIPIKLGISLDLSNVIECLNKLLTAQINGEQDNNCFEAFRMSLNKLHEKYYYPEIKCIVAGVISLLAFITLIISLFNPFGWSLIICTIGFSTGFAILSALGTRNTFYSNYNTARFFYNARQVQNALQNEVKLSPSATNSSVSPNFHDSESSNLNFQV